MNKDYEYKKPLATHEVKRSNILTAIAVIIAAIAIPLWMIPEKEEVKEELYTPQEIQELPEQQLPEEPQVKLDTFGEYHLADQNQQPAWINKVKHFILNYTVLGFIFNNVEQEKVANSFKDLKEKTAPAYNRATKKQ